MLHERNMKIKFDCFKEINRHRVKQAEERLVVLNCDELKRRRLLEGCLEELLFYKQRRQARNEIKEMADEFLTFGRLKRSFKALLFHKIRSLCIGH